MKTKHSLWLVSVVLLVSCAVYASGVGPAWNRVNEDVTFFEKKGFVFEIEDLPDHLYEKETIELIVVIPKTFQHNDLDNAFSSVLLLNDDIGVDVLTFPYQKKSRIIISLSMAMAKKSKWHFYYKNAEKNVTDGTQFVIDIASIIENKKVQQKDVPGKK